jgi:hypothetical protein
MTGANSDVSVLDAGWQIYLARFSIAVYCDRHNTIIKHSFIQPSDRGKNILKILSNIRASDVMRKISGYPR